MNCEQAKPLIQIYADGELDAARVPELEKHLQSCAQCAAALNNLRNLQKALRQESLSFSAPAQLRRQIKADLQVETEPQRESAGSFWRWWMPAGIGLAAACIAVVVTLTTGRPSAPEQLANEVVSSHIRSLMVDHKTDVASTDQHTVKPWFNGKLDFAPPVKDFATEGFPLIGGRLDYIDGRAVAALVYQRQKHVINVFVWPTDKRDSTLTIIPARQGYHVAHWSQGGMDFWTVSDLNEKELAEFANYFSK